MPRLILHIGTHKTGTTSFQRKIKEKSSLIAKKDRVYYIVLQKGYPIQEFMRLTARSRYYEEELRKFLHMQIRRDGTYLISCEYLSGDRETMYANRDIVATMLRYATKDYPTEICVLFRRQDEFIQSMFTQKVHRGEHQTRNIEEYIDSFSLDLLDWNRFTKVHIELFGHENVYVYPYDREFLRKHSVMSILNKRIRSKVLAEVKNEKRENIGYSTVALQIAMKLNDVIPDSQKLILREALQKTGHKQYMAEYNILDRQKKQAIIDYFKEANKKLAKNYFEKDYGITNFCEPIFENSQVNIEDTYFELTKYLLNEIEGGSYFNRNRLVRTVLLLKKALIS